MLERVPLLDKHLDDYADVVEPGTIERIRALAEPLRGRADSPRERHGLRRRGRRAARRRTLPLLQDLGIEAEWQVIHGSDEFFAVTKTVHNALQGADVEWTPHMEHIYLERVLDNALQLEGEWDFVVIHDPQPAAMREYARGRGVAPDSTKWIWRCHIDLTDANPSVCSSSSGRSSSSTTRRCGRCRSSCRPPCRWTASCSRRRASIRCRSRTSTCPLPFVDEIIKQYGVRVR